MPEVTVHRRSKRLYSYDLSSSPLVTVGHDPANDIVLRDMARGVSRHHAALVPRASDGRYFVRDLKSLRGTRVAGRPVDRELLRDGDVIEIGDYQLLFSALTRAAFTRQRVALLNHLSRTKTPRADSTTVLDKLCPLLVKVMQADRGFIRIFSDDGDGAARDVGITGARARDAIGMVESAFMERLLAGRYVRDGGTLLVPLISRHETVGFLCLDRHRPSKPFSDEEGHFLIGVGQAAMTLNDAPRSLTRKELDGPIGWDNHLVGRSAAMLAVIEQIREAAASGDDVLLVGEPGCGKRLAARAVRQYARPDGPFIAKDCGPACRSISETELFGHAPRTLLVNADPAGAPGWFEKANGGVLFLDDIQHLSTATQRKVLNVLDGKIIWRYGAQSPTRIDVQTIAATSVTEIDAAVEQGTIQKGLYDHFRRIEMPPLRDRREDIPLLAFYFLDRCASARAAKTRTISRRALQLLVEYSWPGNVRELESRVLSAVTRCSDVIYSWDLDLPPMPTKMLWINGRATNLSAVRPPRG